MKKVIAIFVFLGSFAFCCAAQTTINGGVAINGQIDQGYREPTPPMGWNSWYAGPRPITESAVETQAAAMDNAALPGLCAVEYPPNGTCVSFVGLGYTLVSIDDSWSQRAANGDLEAIPSNFPDGMAAVGTYIHGHGELFGLYGAPGTTSCYGDPGNFAYEVRDAKTMASWGVDYLKYDWCSDASTVWSAVGDEYAYSTMGSALEASGRRISFLVNSGTPNPPNSWYTWFQEVGANSIRVGGDNANENWYTKATSSLSFAAPYQNKGHWLDFDYLFGGLTEPSGVVGDAEAKAQFNFYAIVSAPLIIGNLITGLDSGDLQTYSNSEVIAVDQDPIGTMGTLISTTTCGSTVCQVWSKHLQNGDIAVAFINYDSTASHSIPITWTALGISGSWNIRDLWAHTSEGSSTTGYTFSAGAWGSTMILLSQ